MISPANASMIVRPSIAVDDAGDAIVVWNQWSLTDETIVARRYVRATDTWSPIVALDAPHLGPINTMSAEVDTDPQGNALAAWSAATPSGFAIRAARFDRSSESWEAPTTLSPLGAFMQPEVIADHAGNFMVAWYRFASSEIVAEAVRYDASSHSFGAATELERAPSWGPAYSPTVDLGVDAAGNVLASFDHSGGTGVSVRVRRFESATSTWTAPLDLTPAGQWAAGAHVAVLPSGDAIAVWRHFGTVYALRSARYVAATGTWTSAIDVGTAETGEDGGRVVLASDGTATVVWSELRSDSVVTRAATSRLGGGWQEPSTLSVRSGNQPDRAQPTTTVDGAGAVTIAWRDLDGVAEALFAVRSTTSVGAPGFVPVSPVRVFDTRAGESPDAVRSVSKVKVGGASVLEVKVTDLAGVVPSSGVGAVSLNVTVTNPEGAGFVTVWPCGPRGLVSSVNYAAGATVANAVIAPVSGSGSVCFFSMVPADLIVDLNGWFPATP